VKSTAENLDFSKSEFHSNKSTSADSEIKIGKWSLELNVDPSFAPKSRLVIYHIVDDKEIVASSITLKIKNCFKHEVIFCNFNREQVCVAFFFNPFLSKKFQ
jgi:Alpha-2-macroglobulin bait region domain